MDCIHFGKQIGHKAISSEKSMPLYRCDHPQVGFTTEPNCEACILKNLPIARPSRSQSQVPATVHSDAVMDRALRPSGLFNAYAGASVFLQLGGPSMRSLDMSRLNQRGIVTFGVNNSPTWHRTNFWTSGDNLLKIHDAIWRDPGIIKFVPSRKLKYNIARVRADGSKMVSGEMPRDFPGVFAMRRNARFNPDEWLAEPSINFGNGRKYGDPQFPNVLSCMFQSLKLCYYLGFRTVYLLGCDFTMDASDRYAWRTVEDAEAAGGNHVSYPKIAALLKLLRPRFDAAGFRVLNCNPQSRLEVFDFATYDRAIEQATAAMPASIDASQLY